MYHRLSLLVAALGTFTVHQLPAENWPQWRGPNGDGTSPESDLPVEWSNKKNVVWRLALPGPAGATPVVWEKHIFLTSVDGEDLLLLAISTDGKERWRRKVGTGNKDVRGDEGNSASPSPVTDGRRVWAFFGTGDLACYDFDGNEVWKVDMQKKHGEYDFWFGMTSTPLLHEDTLYFMCLQMKGSHILAMDKNSGKVIWRTERDSDAVFESKHSYASPVLYRDDERQLLLIHGGDYLSAHALKDGAEVWRCGGLNPKESYNKTLRFIASPVCRPGLIIAPSAKRGPVFALRPDGIGDVTESHRLWTRKRGTPDVSTPVIHGGEVYLLRENGILLCHDAKTGEEIYAQRTHDDRHRASPVVADGKVYCTARDGTVTVVRAGRKFEVLAQNTLGEPISSTPVIAGRRLYLRSFKALHAIEKPKLPATAE